jgi:hypothetical protein
MKENDKDKDKGVSKEEFDNSLKKIIFNVPPPEKEKHKREPMEELTVEQYRDELIALMVEAIDNGTIKMDKRFLNAIIVDFRQGESGWTPTIHSTVYDAATPEIREKMASLWKLVRHNFDQ